MAKKIAVDLCNTVCDVNAVLSELGFKKNPDAYSYPGIYPEFFKKNIWIFQKAAPMEYAAECLWKLAEAYEIVYLSARPAEAYEVSRNYLESYDFPKGEIVFTDKKPAYFLRHEMEFAIDDAPTEIKGYVEAGISVLVPAWAYNKSYKCRFDWKNLYEYLSSGHVIDDFIREYA